MTTTDNERTYRTLPDLGAVRALLKTARPYHLADVLDAAWAMLDRIAALEAERDELVDKDAKMIANLTAEIAVRDLSIQSAESRLALAVRALEDILRNHDDDRCLATDVREALAQIAGPAQGTEE